MKHFAIYQLDVYQGLRISHITKQELFTIHFQSFTNKFLYDIVVSFRLAWHSKIIKMHSWNVQVKFESKINSVSVLIITITIFLNLIGT